MAATKKRGSEDGVNKKGGKLNLANTKGGQALKKAGQSQTKQLNAKKR